jgi:hypothetical protein
MLIGLVMKSVACFYVAIYEEYTSQHRHTFCQDEEIIVYCKYDTRVLNNKKYEPNALASY